VDYFTAIKSGSFHPFSSTERKARAATRNKPSGPTGAQLNELAQLSFNPHDASTIVATLIFRLHYRHRPDRHNRWRNIYKALSVTEFLLRRGSDNIVRKLQGQVTLEVKSIAETTYSQVTTGGQDVGANVTYRARAILILLEDEEKLKAERKAEQAKRGRISGISCFDTAAACPHHQQEQEEEQAPGTPSPSSPHATIDETTTTPAAAADAEHQPMEVEDINPPLAPPSLVEINLMDLDYDPPSQNENNNTGTNNGAPPPDLNDPFAALESIFSTAIVTTTRATTSTSDISATLDHHHQHQQQQQQQQQPAQTGNPFAGALVPYGTAFASPSESSSTGGYHPPWAAGPFPQVHVYDALAMLGPSATLQTSSVSTGTVGPSTTSGALPPKSENILATTTEKRVDGGGDGGKDERWRQLVEQGLDSMTTHAAVVTASRPPPPPPSPLLSPHQSPMSLRGLQQQKRESFSQSPLPFTKQPPSQEPQQQEQPQQQQDNNTDSAWVSF
jgi:hypothetical protein